MTYPNFRNKHLQESLIEPEQFRKYKKWDKKTFPKKIIITYQKKSLKYFKRKYRPRKHIAWEELLLHEKIGLMKMTGMGAPHAVVNFEELVSLGANTFINIGLAGGLHKEGVFLCEKALRDEGTSHHYLPSGRFSYPDKELTKELEKKLIENKIDFSRGATWTIDAPYRETRAEVEHYAKKGISTVEMEASALFAVAKYRKVKIASAFVVSDVLGKKWTPNFHKKDIIRMQNKLIDAAIECLLNIK